MNRRKLLQAAIVAPLAAAVGVPSVAATDDLPITQTFMLRATDPANGLVQLIPLDDFNGKWIAPAKTLRVTSIDRDKHDDQLWRFTIRYDNQHEVVSVECPE